MMNRKEIEEKYEDEQMLFADGFDKAIIGVAHIQNKRIVSYDTKKCIKILMKDMTQEEAVEYFDFNVLGSYVGEYTPAFIEK
jgi:hypothetical protein|tara:strand:+ start:467 stop:712 length:246 start_codon:yes stop_codon:yes gene_type:complete